MEVKIDANIHTSVLLPELVESITIFDDRQNIIVDCTLWLAGHGCEIVKKMNPNDIFIGFDADERNLVLARQNLEALNTKTQIILIQANFSELTEKLAEHEIHKITGIYYDLWVSSLHFDEAERWFSLRLEWPLDMRFDTKSWRTAADIINYSEEKEIYRILKEYGEEPHARKIAVSILKRRQQRRFVTTTDLTDLLDEHVNKHIKTKTRVFQALRIEVNKELEVLQSSLAQAVELLESDGKIFVISFHSLEDRIVKQYFKQESKDCICRDIICTCKHTAKLKLLNKKPILPSEEEQKINRRSRSAKARQAQKI